MSVDKFGRHHNIVTVRRETKRTLRESIGFRLTDDGDINVENKKIRNLEEPQAAKDAVSLTFMQQHCLLVDHDHKSVDVKGCKLRNVEEPVDFKDVVNKFYVDNKCVQYSSGKRGGGIIDARNQWIIDVRDPQQANDVANKKYVDARTIKKAADSWLFGNSWLSQVKSPILSSDAVNFKFMLDNTVSLRDDDVFNGAGKRITNVANGSADTDVVNVRQMNELRRHTKSELYKMNNIFRNHIEKLAMGMNKLHTSIPRSSEDGEEPEWTLNREEVAALIETYDKSTEVRDWRSVYGNE
jgi:hypothetical protein